MFQPAKCSFYDIAFLVYVARVAAFADTVRFGRDAGLCARSDDRIDDQLAVVALVCNDVFCRDAADQFRRDGKVGDVAARQDKMQRYAVCVGCHVYFRGQASSGAPQSLVLAPPFPAAAC